MLNVSSESVGPTWVLLFKLHGSKKLRIPRRKQFFQKFGAVQQQKQPLKKSAQQTIPPLTAAQKNSNHSTQNFLRLLEVLKLCRLTASLRLHRVMLAQDTHHLPKLLNVIFRGPIVRSSQLLLDLGPVALPGALRTKCQTWLANSLWL